MIDTQQPFAVIPVHSFRQIESTIFGYTRTRRAKEMVYRGQSDSDWNLVPSLFRDYDSAHQNQNEWLRTKIKEEYQNVSEFVRTADELGFQLPGNYFDLLNERYLKNNTFAKWYHKDLNPHLELIALAQHYGVKTRFLDFTTDAFTALYFAAEEVVNKFLSGSSIESLSGRCFSLWAIDAYYFFYEECTTPLVRAPSSRNRYLNAQKGLFLTVNLPEQPDTGPINGHEIDLHAAIIDSCHEIKRVGEGFTSLWPIIIRYDIPYQLAPTVIRKLDDRGINLTTIRPNLDNIVRIKDFRKKVNSAWSKMEQEFKDEYPEGFLE